jgi:hypothetical protein
MGCAGVEVMPNVFTQWVLVVGLCISWFLIPRRTLGACVEGGTGKCRNRSIEEHRNMPGDKPNILVIWGDDIGISNEIIQHHAWP